MADPVILPQYRGDYYQLQRKQALADALMQKSLQGSPQPQLVGSGDYKIMPKIGALSAFAPLVEALAGRKLGNDSSQGINQLGQQQWGSLFPMMGGSQPPQPSAGSPDTATGSTAVSGAASGQPTSAGAVPAQSGSGPAVGAVNQGSMNPLGMDPGMATMMYLSNPDEFYKTQAQAYIPTDMQKSLRGAGIDPGSALGHQLMQQYIAKQNYVSPTSLRGQVYADEQGIHSLPSQAPEGYQNIQSTDGKWYTVPVQGGTEAVQGYNAAKTAGEGSQLPYSGFDVDAKPLPITSRTAAVSGAVPNAGFPAGTKVPGTGVDNSDRLSILQQERQQITSRPDTDPGKAFDLQSINREIANASPKAIYGAQAPGIVAGANSQAKGQVDSMQKSFQGLQNVRSGGQMALTDIDRMIDLGSQKSFATAGPLAPFAKIFSPNAAEYEKSRDNLVTNIGSQLGMGTDAARALVYGSVPEYGAPKEAIQKGLQTLKNQVQTRMVKSNFMTDIYNKGDPAIYNQKENEFDQTITPNLAPILSMPAGAARADALKTAAKDPQQRSKLEWAVQNGLIK